MRRHRSGPNGPPRRSWTGCVALVVASAWTLVTLVRLTPWSSAPVLTIPAELLVGEVQAEEEQAAPWTLPTSVFGWPTVLDPSGRSGRARLDNATSHLARRVISRLGEWRPVAPRLPEAPKQPRPGEPWRPHHNRTPTRYVPFEFCESSAVRFADALVVIGGFLCDFNRVTDKVQMLNRTTGEWLTIATLPSTAAKTHQGAATLELPRETWVYMVSGQLGPGCTLGTAESWALLIRGKKAQWYALPDLPEIRYAPSAFVDEGHLHVVGGAGPNRQDPRAEHWVLPLLANGKPAKSGWFPLKDLPGGGADSCGQAISHDHFFRFGGQHGHPRAVNVLVDNNKQCQSSPEVAHTLSMRRALRDPKGADWQLVAPLPWPASHIGLSTVAHGADVLVVSGKDGKGVTPRIAAYDVVADRWRALRSLPFGQPDYLVWFDTDGLWINALKFRWHPTNTTLNHDMASLTRPDGKVANFAGALTHWRAHVKYEAAPPTEVAAAPASPLSFDGHVRRLHQDFGAEVQGIDLHAWLRDDPAQLGAALRAALDDHGVLVFRAAERQLTSAELVMVHSLFEHDVDAPPFRYHRGMCRLWRSGFPQVNLLANRAVEGNATLDRGGLADDGEPCVAGNIYGMEAFAWHSDETARPDALPVRYTVFQAAILADAEKGETHFTSATYAFERLSPTDKRLAASLKLRYVYNPKSLDAFLPPLDVAGKQDSWLRPDGTAKLEDPQTEHDIEALVATCKRFGTCREHSSPLVTPHPRTRKPALHLDVKQQIGFDSALNFSESQRFLHRVLAPATQVAYKHRWQIGDVVITDNYAVLHTAAPANGFNSAPRLIERICVPGGVVPRPLNADEISQHVI